MNKKSSRHEGVRVQRVYRGSDAFRAGIRAGDKILAVNDELVVDELDFSFLCAQEFLSISLNRHGRDRSVEVDRIPGSFLGIDLVQQPIGRCANRCVFCFIDQLPSGLRKSLYIKDEDYRHSFLNGSYITLSSLDDHHLERIAVRGISPLYISVHATDADVRRRMLRNRFAGRILEQLSFLIECDIQLHTQIVVCPGYNDGAVLKKTIFELLSLGDGVQSVAVVPVGLTRFRKEALTPVDGKNAREIIEYTAKAGDQDAEKNGFRRLFAADEFFIKAGVAIPQTDYYQDFPQIENGVGLVRSLLNECEETCREFSKISRKDKTNASASATIVTSISAASFIRHITGRLRDVFPGVRFDVVSVVNEFFGDTVSVAGLLTAADMIQAVRKQKQGVDRLFIPSSALNYRGYTLDGYSLSRIEKTLGLPVHAPKTLREMISLCID